MGFIEDKRFLKYNARCIFFDRYNGVSKKPFDSLNLSFNVGDKEDNVIKNLSIIKNTVSAKELGMIKQVHSNVIIEFDNQPHDADGFYTAKNSVFLGIKFADCMPIIMMDTKTGVIMAVHAGWRGSFLNISGNAVKKFKALGSKAEDIIVSVGPHICSNCYEIKQDVAEKFPGGAVVCKNGRIFLDLYKINRQQMIEEGIRKENINSVGICTYENKDFFSYRRDKICGRNIGGIIKF